MLVIGAGHHPAQGAEPKQGGQTKDIADQVEKDLRSELMSAVKTNPKLHGAWIELTIDRDAATRAALRCTIDVMIDKDSAVAKQQRDEIDRIARKSLKDYPYRVAEIARLPIHGFLKRLQARIDLDPKLAGTQIDDAWFSDSSSEAQGDWQMFLELAGCVAADEQRTTVIDLANKLIEDELQESAIHVKTLADSVPVEHRKDSGELASHSFNQGTEHFFHREFDTAYRLFTQAARDAPERVEYQYWRVLSLLGSRRDDDATVLLENLIKQRIAVNKSPRMESVVYRSLERVRGPIRQRMVQIENRLLTDKLKTSSPR
jgi:hypothetical protein